MDFGQIQGPWLREHHVGCDAIAHESKSSHKMKAESSGYVTMKLPINNLSEGEVEER